jgi:hypothetical protein
MVTRNLDTPPGTILLAFFGYLVSTVVALAGAVVLFSSRQHIVDALRTASAQSGGRLTDQQIQQAATTGQAIGIGVLVVIAVCYLLLAFRLKGGRNPARVVLAVITVLQLVSLAVTRGTVVSDVSAAAAVIACVASFLPASNRYVHDVKRAA